MDNHRQKMHSRRDFLKHALLVSGAAGAAGAFPKLLRKAMAIEPEAGSTFFDAEHVVVLMQENRSFDHCFGTLRGVRGFNDPRALTLPDGYPVWAQADEAGRRFLPFRLDIRQTNATWLGDLPHTRDSQLEAWNQGSCDRWIPAKRPPVHGDPNVPLTMGFHTREDIPFYYALADAFTICDQHFSSVMSCTNPNRGYLWTGTLRDRQQPDVPAKVQNEDLDFGRWANWTTFPERLEENQIPWNVYQNELAIGSGLGPEEEAWLANFGDNPLEYFSQFNVQFAAPRRRHVQERIQLLRARIEAIKEKLTAGTDAEQAAMQKEFDSLFQSLGKMELESARYSDKNYARLTDRQKSLHARAFCTNIDDPDYRSLEPITYRDGPIERHLNIPKSDLLSRFRKDVDGGSLAAVSWVVAPHQFSDHPSSAWFGAWYVSQILEILTRAPEVWKKTIFILNYDENDGFFDHVPPFVAPRPGHAETGMVSAGIDAAMEYDARAGGKPGRKGQPSAGSPIGLGYRVPMVIASPWTRGGRVCSQVFDHTSVLQFLETWLTKKTGRKIEEPNISRWRRAVCGDLTSAFGAAGNENVSPAPFGSREAFIAQIHQAQFKKAPDALQPLREDQLKEIRENPQGHALMFRQESGVRPSCPLPYELEVSGSFNQARDRFVLNLKAGNERFGARSAGAPFIVYAQLGGGKVQVRHYAVKAGDELQDSWALGDFSGNAYHLRVDGPNGFFREFIGDANDPGLEITLAYPSIQAGTVEADGGIEVQVLSSRTGEELKIRAADNAYGSAAQTRVVGSGARTAMSVPAQHSFGWYDFTLTVAGSPQFRRRCAGRVETGRWGFSDPQMAGEKT